MPAHFAWKETMDQKKLDDALAVIEKQHGRGSIFRLGGHKAMKVDVIPTGILSVDTALGVGGVPRGRVIEIFGPEGGGKTTLALQIIAQAQQSGLAAFVDAEHALDPSYARKLNVDVDNLLCSQPDYGEQALEIVETLVRSGQLDVVVVDSVAALVPKAELDGEMGDAQMGLHARLMSQAMRKLCAVTAKSRTCLIFINQVREKIGVMFGNPEVTTGGRALKFYASIRIEVRRSTILKNGDVAYGSMSKIKVVKNKVATPFREAEPEMIWGQGFSEINDFLNLAAHVAGIVEKSGSWYSYKGERIGQGKENAVAFLSENASMAQALFMEVRAKLIPVPLEV